MNKAFKNLSIGLILGFALSSCEAPLKLNSYLSKNVLWSSDDGKIEIICQGFGSERGRAILRINDEDVETTVYFSDRYDCLSFAKPTEEEGHVTEVMDLDDHNMRRAILSRVCKNISHKYMNGINCIYLNFNRT